MTGEQDSSLKNRKFIYSLYDFLFSSTMKENGPKITLYHIFLWTKMIFFLNIYFLYSIQETKSLNLNLRIK